MPGQVGVDRGRQPDLAIPTHALANSKEQAKAAGSGAWVNRTYSARARQARLAQETIRRVR